MKITKRKATRNLAKYTGVVRRMLWAETCTKINLDPKHVDSTADRGRVPEQPARKALEAKDRLDEGRGKTGVGDVVGWKEESQEGGEGQRMISRRYTSYLFIYGLFFDAVNIYTI
jgi:hypothetical protein